MATADEVTLVLDAQTQGYQRKLKEAEATFKGFSSRIKESALEFGKGLVALVAVQEIVNLGKELVNAAADTYTLARALGILPSDLKALEDATLSAGGEVESLDQNLKFLSKTVGEARSGGESKKFFAALGIDINASRSLTAIYADVIDAVSGLKSAQDRAAISSRLFGRSLDGVNASGEQVRGALADANRGFDETAKAANDARVALREAGDALATGLTPYAVSAATDIANLAKELSNLYDVFSRFKDEGFFSGKGFFGTGNIASDLAEHANDAGRTIADLRARVPGLAKFLDRGTTAGPSALPSDLFASGAPKQVDITLPRTRLEGLTDSWNKLTDATREYTDAAASAFADVVTGADTLQSALSQLLKQFANMAAQTAFKALFEAGTNTLFGGGKYAGMLAAGGLIPHGSYGIVGERGPELVMAGQGGARVKPFGGGSGGSFGGGGGIVLNSTVNAPGASGDDLKRVLDVRDRALLAQLPQAIQKHQRNRRFQ